jgi:hypothetical protein
VAPRTGVAAHRRYDTRAEPPHRRPGQLVRAGGATCNGDTDNDRAERPVRGEERETRENAERGK